MLLFHGTSTTYLEQIRAEGLNNPYLTDDLEIATYYAGCAVDDEGGEAVIIEVNVDPDRLLPDTAAIDEPVLRDEEEVWALFEQIPDDWREGKDAWRVSMDLVSAVRIIGSVAMTGEIRL